MKKDIFENFSIGEFSSQAGNMTYFEFLSFCKSILDSIENFDLSDNGLYREKKDLILKLYNFVKSAEVYVRTDGATSGGNSETDLAYLKAILCGIKKRHNLL